MNFHIRKSIEITEAEIFSEVHHFLLRKNNRYLTNDELVEKTGISHELIHKWVKTGKLKQSLFPNLGAPCEKCGKITNYSKLRRECTTTITNTLMKEEKDKEWFNKIQTKTKQHTYHYK